MARHVIQRDIKQLIIALAIIFVIGYLSSFVYWRIDLTSDKRYTLSDITKIELTNLNSEVYMRIYLDGDLPIGFKRMQKALIETLEEFRVYSHKKVQYELINPSESSNPNEQKKAFDALFDKGVQPTNVQEKDDKGGSSQKLIFPGALMNYNGKEFALNFLNNNSKLSGDENINLSIQNFEFKLIDAIQKLSIDTLPKLAFIHGHGELDEYETGDIYKNLSEYFIVDRVEINGDIKALEPYSVIIIAGPTKPVNESDKLVIDQFVMKGGKVLWFVDPIQVSIDSLSKGSTTLAYPNDVNLEDILFRYGARLNPTLVQDMQCSVIPVNVSLVGQQPKFIPAPWVYNPLLIPSSNDPITRNLNLIKSQFISPIDTVGGNGNIHKKILLTTSQYSRLLQVPLFVNLEQINKSPLEREFNIAFVPVAVLLEGTFESVFINRPLSKYNNGKPFELIHSSAKTRMIVVSDADIIRNDVRMRPDGAYISPLGFDRYTSQTFGNKDLVMNMVKYLNDDSGILNLRNRDFKLRMLDKKKVLESRLKWQVINTILPSLILIICGLIWMVIRKRRYAN